MDRSVTAIDKLPIYIVPTQSRKPIIKPEMTVEKDQVEALNDIASELLFGLVFLIVKGNAQTLINIIPIPQSKNEN